MELAAVLAAADPDSRADRSRVYAALLTAEVYVRAPADRTPAVTRPDTGQQAVPCFVSPEDAVAFWRQTAPGRPAPVAAVAFGALAGQALAVGAVVLDPLGAGLMIERADLVPLAAGEIPGAFAVYLQELSRLGREPREVLSRLRQAHVHVLTGQDPQGGQRLHLLEKSEDGTIAVPCFSAPETLAQFGEVRRLAGDQYGVALYSGAEVIRIAAGLGAYILVDPESPWETQLEPSLLLPLS